jgi:hypothetical protein
VKHVPLLQRPPARLDMGPKRHLRPIKSRTGLTPAAFDLTSATALWPCSGWLAAARSVHHVPSRSRPSLFCAGVCPGWARVSGEVGQKRLGLLCLALWPNASPSPGGPRWSSLPDTSVAPICYRAESGGSPRLDCFAPVLLVQYQYHIDISIGEESAPHRLPPRHLPGASAACRR